MKNGKVIVLIVAALSVSDVSSDELTTRHTEGRATAERLTQRFNDTRDACESPTGPAYECTGILLRGTVASDNYYSWNPNPINPKKLVGFGGTSFAYIRADSEFSWLPVWIANGFILYPERQTPPGKITLTEMCYFPVDGWTDARGESGCGRWANAATGDECSRQGVQTAQQWEARFRATGNANPRNLYFCGFSLTNQSPEAEAREFSQALKVRALLKAENPVPDQASQNDEFRMKTWEQNIPERLPIEAFFTFSGKADGIKGARHDQQDYYRQTGEVVPVIELTLQSKDEKGTPHALFAYHEQQQADLDFTGCKRYIQSAAWVSYTDPTTRKSGQQLQIVPTACGRTLPESETNAAFAELRRKYGGGPQWVAKPPLANNPSASGDATTDSLRRQFVCLLVKYPQKDVWNIETFRPYVSMADALAKDCNP